MTKKESQIIQMWITTVRHDAYELSQTTNLSVATCPNQTTRARALAETKAWLDEDIILVLTSGLPGRYDMLIMLS